MDYDLLAVDLDGTLLDSAHHVPEANRIALHRAHQAGLRIVLCTGRSYTETRPIIEQIGLDLDATVTVFGALVTEVATGSTLDRTPIRADVALDASAWFRDAGHPVLWLTDPNEIGHDGYVIDGHRRHAAVDAWLARTPCRVHSVPDAPRDGTCPLRLSVIDDADVLEQLSGRLRVAFDGRLTHNILRVPAYDLSLIEAFAPVVNKWFGIEKLCRRWRIDPRRTIAIGNDVNDVAMIHAAGVGVAVANAPPAVLNVADRVTASNDACGVAQLIDELLS